MTDWLKRAEDSLDDLIATDRQLAELRVKWERDRRKAKREYAIRFKLADGKNIRERESNTETNEQFQSTQAAEMTSLLEYEAMKNKRDTCRLVIEFWKSWQRAVREGEI